MTDPAALEARIAKLEGRLHEVESVQAIHRLKARYAALVDARYHRGQAKQGAELEAAARGIADLFTEDGVWDGGKALGLCEGREAIYERMCKPTLLFSWHFFLKPDVAVDGDRARASWDLLSPCTTTDGKPHWMAGVEEDEYAEVDGVWLHTHMKLKVVFLSPHETGWTRVLI